MFGKTFPFAISCFVGRLFALLGTIDLIEYTDALGTHLNTWELPIPYNFVWREALHLVPDSQCVVDSYSPG